MNKKIKILIKPIRLFLYSYFVYHLIVWITTFATTFLIKKIIDHATYTNDFVEILNGFGVLTAFYILALDKVDFSYIKSKLKTNRKVFLGKKPISFGSKIINTVFSATVSMFILLGLNYLILLFGIKSLLLLVALGYYLFSGFFLVLILWHSIEI